MMNVKRNVLYTSISLCLISAATFASAVTIPNPLGAVNSFCALLTNIANGIGIFIATLGTIMIVISGIMYLISAGSPERINKAKTALVYAIVGIVVGISASTIVAIVKQILSATGKTC